jgi:hypothetical protein
VHVAGLGALLFRNRDAAAPPAAKNDDSGALCGPSTSQPQKPLLGIVAAPDAGAAGSLAAATSTSDAAPAALCRLHVESNPVGADVALDGVPAGHTPLDLEHACVEVNVTIDHARYERWHQKITLSASAVTDLKASLHHHH